MFLMIWLCMDRSLFLAKLNLVVGDWREWNRGHQSDVACLSTMIRPVLIFQNNGFYGTSIFQVRGFFAFLRLYVELSMCRKRAIGPYFFAIHEVQWCSIPFGESPPPFFFCLNVLRPVQ